MVGRNDASKSGPVKVHPKAARQRSNAHFVARTGRPRPNPLAPNAPLPHSESRTEASTCAGRNW